MGWIDSILNFIMPPIIIIALIYILYKPFKPMLKGLGAAFKGLWDKIRGNEPEQQQYRIKNIVYE